MVCKGICTRYKAQKPSVGSRYANGQKRCQECEIFIRATEDQIYCQCCGTRLRGKPRKMEYKEKVRLEKEFNEETNIIDACKRKENLTFEQCTCIPDISIEEGTYSHEWDCPLYKEEIEENA